MAAQTAAQKGTLALQLAARRAVQRAASSADLLAGQMADPSVPVMAVLLVALRGMLSAALLVAP